MNNIKIFKAKKLFERKYFIKQYKTGDPSSYYIILVSKYFDKQFYDKQRNTFISRLNHRCFGTFKEIKEIYKNLKYEEI